MARIVYSALVESIRGSIAGTTFQKNAYGYTVKKKPNMVRPWTADQKIMQIAFSRAVKAWKEADSTTRSNWETWASTNPQYAKHNPSSQLSGFACFTKWHVQAFIAGLAQDNAPVLTVPDQPAISFSIINSSGTLTISIVCPDGAEAWNLNLFISRPFGAAQNFIGTKTRYVAQSTDATQSADITSAYASKFGTVPGVGDRVALDVVRYQESGGQVNSRVQEIITVTAS
jgi:hypothetical protein